MDDINLEFAKGGAYFAVELFNLLSAGGVKENIIFSPFSIQTCVALAFAGATGETAYEIAKVLHFVSISPLEVGKSFQSVLEKYQKSRVLKLANKVYGHSGMHFRSSYDAVIKKHYHSDKESINFALSDEAAKSINAWVKAKTEGKITQLVTPDCFDDQTSLVLLNALHFKGKWMHRFKECDTNEYAFWVSEHQTVNVNYMHLTEHFGYATFPDLECTALDMPYRDSDLSMFVMLPFKRNGLEQLVLKLKTVNLVDLAHKLNNVKVEAKFPKFKMEHSVNLVDNLKKLGITKMFSNTAEFDHLLKSDEGVFVSNVMHKAIIEVNEDGNEVVSSGLVVTAVLSFIIFPQFHADHPFLYFIWNRRNILFAGAFVNAPTA